VISLYRPGTSILHRMPAGPKLLVFALLAFAMGILASDPLRLGVAVVVTVVLYVIAGVGLRQIALQTWAVKWVLLVTIAAQFIVLPPLTAAVNSGRVLVIIVLCALITLTTRVPDMLAAVERGLGPFRRFGVNPATVGLLLALTITAIPTITRFATEIRDAQRARGVPIRPQTFVVPLLIASLRHADDVGEALLARGAE
jgi:biotin transport system permease protein